MPATRSPRSRSPARAAASAAAPTDPGSLDNASLEDMANEISFGQRIFQKIMTDYRSLTVVIFALPLSLVWDTLLWLRTLMQSSAHSASAKAEHEARVREMVEQVRARPAGKRMCSGRPGWQSMSLSYRPYKQRSHAINTVCKLTHFVSIDLEGEDKTITVEPLVSIGQLTQLLLPRGYTLPVVPEMDDLTVGGLVAGTGIESSSHRHGLFHEQCVAFELCLADGTVVTASRTEHADLFHAVPWSYGTLCFVLSVKLRVVPCQPYVRLTYTPYTEKSAALAHFAALSSAGDAAPEFVEALAFSPTAYVVMAGEQVARPDRADGVVNTLSYWFKPWFFKHVEAKVGDAKPSVEYIPLRDYYHRHTRSMFWEMELMLPVGNHPIARYLLGWLLPPKVSFLKLTQTEMTRRLTKATHVAQDFMLPMGALGDMLELCDDVYDQLYPIWLCPHAHRSMPGTIMVEPSSAAPSAAAAPSPASRRSKSPGRVKIPARNPAKVVGSALPAGTHMFVDLGVYGLPSCVKRDPVGHGFNMQSAMRVAEQRLREIGGVQMLYADIYQTRDEFEQMFPHAAYRKLRAKYGANEVFPEVYDKINVALTSVN